MILCFSEAKSPFLMQVFSYNKNLLAEKKIKTDARLDLITEIANFLTDEKLDIKKLKKIIFVNKGSFTTVRAVCLIVNILARELEVKIVEIKENITDFVPYLAKKGKDKVEPNFSEKMRIG